MITTQLKEQIRLILVESIECPADGHSYSSIVEEICKVIKDCSKPKKLKK